MAENQQELRQAQGSSSLIWLQFDGPRARTVGVLTTPRLIPQMPIVAHRLVGMHLMHTVRRKFGCLIRGTNSATQATCFQAAFLLCLLNPLFRRKGWGVIGLAAKAIYGWRVTFAGRLYRELGVGRILPQSPCKGFGGAVRPSSLPGDTSLVTGPQGEGKQGSTRYLALTAPFLRCATFQGH